MIQTDTWSSFGPQKVSCCLGIFPCIYRGEKATGLNYPSKVGDEKRHVRAMSASIPVSPASGAARNHFDKLDLLEENPEQDSPIIKWISHWETQQTQEKALRRDDCAFRKGTLQLEG